MVTDWPSWAPICAMVLMGAGIGFHRGDAEDAEKSQFMLIRLAWQREIGPRFSDGADKQQDPSLRMTNLNLTRRNLPEMTSINFHWSKGTKVQLGTPGGDLRIFQLLEGRGHFLAGALFFFAVDFEQQGRLLRGCAQQFHGLLPVDRSVAGPEVRVFIFVVVVHMSRADVVLEDSEAFGDAVHHVRVAAIEADADVVEMHGFDELDQTVGRGQFVGNIFNEHSYAERFGEGAQVLNGGHRGFEFLFVEGVVRIADVLDEKTEG